VTAPCALWQRHAKWVAWCHCQSCRKHSGAPVSVFRGVRACRLYGYQRRAKFGTPETSLRGKRICSTGKISDYHGKAEIVLNDPSQLSQ
jgi:hypothetical protein